MEKIVIIGGGVAGLSCLNSLLDRNISALLIEGSSIGTPKICGEYIGPFAMSQLQKWDIGPIQPITQIFFNADHRELNLKLPRLAGAFARSQIELQLAARAKNLSGRILENSRIQNIIPATSDSPYILTLETGETIHADIAIFASGKFSTPLPSVYAGFKFHLPILLQPQSLYMFSESNLYFGMVPVSDNVSNCAGLIHKKEFEGSSLQDFFLKKVAKNPTLQGIFDGIDFSSLSWMEGQAPQFGLRNNPAWPRSYWIGDAQAAWHPAIGNGVNHSVHTAELAADSVTQKHSVFYQAATKSAIQKKLLLSGILHTLLLKPQLTKFLFGFLKRNSWIQTFFLKKLGYYDNSNNSNCNS